MMLYVETVVLVEMQRRTFKHHRIFFLQHLDAKQMHITTIKFRCLVMSSVDVLKEDAKTSLMNIFWRIVEEIMNVLQIMKLILTLRMVGHDF